MMRCAVISTTHLSINRRRIAWGGILPRRERERKRERERQTERKVLMAGGCTRHFYVRSLSRAPHVHPPTHPPSCAAPRAWLCTKVVTTSLGTSASPAAPIGLTFVEIFAPSEKNTAAALSPTAAAAAAAAAPDLGAFKMKPKKDKRKLGVVGGGSMLFQSKGLDVSGAAAAAGTYLF